jgi:putative aldouronate transport system permease protein
VTGINHFIRTIRKEGALHLMLLPPVIALLVYKYIPMPGIVMAFQNYKPTLGIWGSPWVGLENYSLLFSMPGFVNAIWNTVIIAVCKIVLHILVPVTFSLLLNEMMSRSVKKTLQTIVYMPHFISWVLMSGIIIKISSQYGIVNQFLGLLGVEPVMFLAKNEWFQPIVIGTDIWKEFGYGTVIYLAAIAGVNPNLHEAAIIDGAGHWRRMLHVTLPGIASTIVLMTALSLGRILDAGFDQIFNLYSPIVYKSGDIIDTFVYRMAFENAQFSISTAAGFFKSLISCVLIVLSYRIAYVTSGYRLF